MLYQILGIPYHVTSCDSVHNSGRYTIAQEATCNWILENRQNIVLQIEFACLSISNLTGMHMFEQLVIEVICNVYNLEDTDS